MANICKICANPLDNESFTVREMMFGMRENFNYFRCSSCGCLQIIELPKEMNKYYPSESYYSYQQPQNKSIWYQKPKNIIKLTLFNMFYHFKGISLLKKAPYIKTLESLTWLKMLIHEKAIKKTSSILDVGCGTGGLLQEMNVWGFKNLTGIDPFIEKDILLNDRGGKIFKNDIFNHTDETYDFIMLHHSFEHMDNPLSVLKKLNKMLNPNGYLLIRIPVSDSFAWRKYGTDWFQVDAPRHFFIHTTKSMSHLSKNAGLVLKQTVYDSTEGQFLFSEKYRRNISLFENMDFPTKYVNSCKKQARWLNQIMDGDQACFLFQKEKLI